jgi:hypothetical protein
MPVASNVYLDPGVYQEEVINPNALALGQLVSLLAVVGIAPRLRYVYNEAVRRGQVANESVTFAGSSPHTATTINIATRKQDDTVLIRNGTDVMPDNSYQWLPATVTGINGTFNIAANSFLTMNMDKKGWISIPITAGAARTAAQVCTDINSALAASPLYGVAYNNVATVSGSAVKLLSPNSASPQLSDIRFIATPTDTPTYGADAKVIIFGGSNPFIAQSTLQLFDAFWTGTDTFTISYVAVDTLLDALANTNVQEINRVGMFANVTSFQNLVDYTLNSNSVDWTLNTSATLTGLNGTFNITAGNNILRCSFNGLGVVNVTLPIGAAITAAQIATAINQALIASSLYGPLYGAVASVSGSAVALTLPSPFKDMPVAQGTNSTIEFYAVAANAVTTVFGISTLSLPFQANGSADQPVVGATYFVSYDYTRPATDYNSSDPTTHLFYNSDDALAYTGPLTKTNAAQNTLGIAAKIAFENNAQRLLLIQANDSTTPGFPTINQMKAAIDSAANNSGITELVVLDTRLGVQTYLVTHVTNQSSITEKNYRRGWFGMARNTPVGDKDTAGSFVYTAQRTLQVTPDSPGRGRMLLSAPSNVSKTITLSDGSEKTIALDSTYLAVATAATMTSFISPATALLRKTIVGFDLDTFQLYQKGERKTLAASGVNVITPLGGRLVLTDPVTTEQGAGGLPEFIEPSAGAQKDNAVRAIDSALDANMVGLVPSDLADFVNDIKGFIAVAIRALIEAGSLGRYTDRNGRTRDIDLATDIQVYQSPTDPTKFFFRYWFNIRYPAKRLMGQYSVDNPFVNNNQNSIQTS